jgi:hypothetical protein
MPAPSENYGIGARIFPGPCALPLTAMRTALRLLCISEALARWVRADIIPVIEPSEARPCACRWTPPTIAGALSSKIVSLLAEGGARWLLPTSIAAAVVVLAGLALTQPLAVPGAGGAAPAVAVARALPLRFWIWIAFAFLYGICETLFGNWERSTCTSSAPLPIRRQSGTRCVLGSSNPRSAARRGDCHQGSAFRALPVLIVIALACVGLSSSAVFGVAAFALAGLSAGLPLSIGTASGETHRFVETISGWMVAS